MSQLQETMRVPEILSSVLVASQSLLRREDVVTTIETAISGGPTTHTVVKGESETSTGTYIPTNFNSMEPSAASTEMQPTTSFSQISSNEANSNSPSRETSPSYEHYHICNLTITGCGLNPSGTFASDRNIAYCTALRSINCHDDRELSITLTGCMNNTIHTGMPSELVIQLNCAWKLNSATTLPSSSDTVRYAA